MSEVIVLGRDGTGVIAESHSMRYYLTECCGASATGTADGVACRACYEPIPEALGGMPDRVILDEKGRIEVVARGEMIEVYGDGLPYDEWKARRAA